MATVTLTADGHFMIPEAIRRRLGLSGGDRLQVELGDERTLVVRPTEEKVEEPSKLFGLLEHLARSEPVSVEEMKEAVAEGANERFQATARR